MIKFAYVPGVHLRNSAQVRLNKTTLSSRRKHVHNYTNSERGANNITIPRGLNSVSVGHASVMLACNKKLLHLYEADTFLRRTARAGPELNVSGKKRVHCSLVHLIARLSRAPFIPRKPSARGSLYAIYRYAPILPFTLKKKCSLTWSVCI